MSGGRFEYTNDQLANMIFGWPMSPNYGDTGFSQARAARKINPLDDKQLSELLWDMLCLLHSYDWCESGDTGKETYKADVKYFKKKWLRISEAELVKREIDNTLAEARDDLYTSLLSQAEGAAD